MAGYILPTGYSDPNGIWGSETLAYNNNTDYGDAARCTVPAWSWSGYLVLTVDPVYCSKLKFFARYDGTNGINKIDLDVYYSGAWHNVYEGSFLNRVWTEKSLGGSYYVSQLRIRFYNNDSSVKTALLYEAHFYETTGIPKVTTNAATGVSGALATLNGNITDVGGATCTVRGFKYKEGIAGEEQDASDSGAFGTGAFSEALTGLDPTKKYYFKAYATNTAGTGYGAWKSFGVTIAAPTVTSGAATSVDHEKATLNGNITTTGGQDCTERGFQWKIGAGGDIDTLPETGTFGVGAYSILLDDLDANVIYYFRAYAKNSAGTSYGDWLNFTTDITNPTVITHNATDELETQVTGNGEIVSTGGVDCDGRGFDYGLSKVATWMKEESAGSYGVGFFDIDIDGLTANTEYWYRAWAKRYGAFSKLDNPSNLPTGEGQDAKFSHDDNYLAVAHMTTPYITIYKRSGDVFTKLDNPADLPANHATCVAWSHDSTYLAVGHTDSPYVTIYKRSGDTFTKLDNPADLPVREVSHLAWSPTSLYLHASDGTLYSSGGTLYKRTGDTFAKLTHPAPTGISDTAFSPDGNYFAKIWCTAETKYCYIYKITAGDTFTKLDDPVDLPDAPLSVAWSHNSTYLSVGQQASPYIFTWKRSGDTFTKLADPVTAPTSFLSDLAYSHDSSFLACIQDNEPEHIIYKRSGDVLTKFDDLDPTVSGTSGSTIVFSNYNNNYIVFAHSASPYINIYARTVDAEGYGEWVKFITAAPGLPGAKPSGYKNDVCSDDSGYSFILNRSLTDDGATYESYFVLSTDLSGKKTLHTNKRLLDIFSYFINKGTGTAKIYVKRDTEPDWQYAGEVSLAGEDEIIIRHLPSENEDTKGDVDFLAKTFLIKFVFENDFEFIGMITEAVPIGDR